MREHFKEWKRLMKARAEPASEAGGLMACEIAPIVCAHFLLHKKVWKSQNRCLAA